MKQIVTIILYTLTILAFGQKNENKVQDTIITKNRVSLYYEENVLNGFLGSLSDACFTC